MTTTELHPPRWAPAFIRWQHTEIGWVKSWRYALGALWSGYRHTIYDYVARLPGQDDIVVARAPLAKFVVVRNPDIARHVLVSNQDNYAKNAEYDLLAVAFGRGLVTDLNDELWQRNRRLVQPIFAKRQVDSFAPQMTAACVAAAERWERHAATGEPLDVAAEMNYVTLDIIARTMFGIDLSDDLAKQRCVSTSPGCSRFSGTASSAGRAARCGGSPTGWRATGPRSWPRARHGWPSARCVWVLRSPRRAPCAGCAASNASSTG